MDDLDLYHLVEGVPPFGFGRAVAVCGRRIDLCYGPLPTDLVWLNTAKPLRLEELRGKFVLLDFWTYCCINCMHVIPELKRLEKGYPTELVVIGVHSAKFSNERLTDNIRQAILRYEIGHPVVNDKEMQIWRSYAVRSWPTLVLVDPEGYVIGAYSGEGN